MREEFQLACGVVAVFEMPDMYKLVGGGYNLPNTALRDVLALNNNRLENRRGASDADEIEIDRRIVVAGYEIAALCVTSPRIILPRDSMGSNGQPRPLAEGEISYLDLTQGEVTLICNKFRYGIPINVPPAANTRSGVGAEPAPAGAPVREGTE